MIEFIKKKIRLYLLRSQAKSLGIFWTNELTSDPKLWYYSLETYSFEGEIHHKFTRPWDSEEQCLLEGIRERG